MVVPHTGSERSPTPNRAGDRVDLQAKGSKKSTRPFGLPTGSRGRAIGHRYWQPPYSRLGLKRIPPESWWWVMRKRSYVSNESEA